MSSYEIRRSLSKGGLSGQPSDDWRLPRYALGERYLREDKRLCQGPACPVADLPK